MLSEEQLKEYKETGVLCIENFATPEQCAALKKRAEEIVEDFDPKTFTVFNTTGEQSQYLDNYFLESSSNISCFFEEKAFDENKKLVQPKASSINKIGHALHDLDPTFKAIGEGSEMQALLRDLGFKQPLPIQSTFIFKQPRIGGEVSVHQDATFLYTDPITVVGLWIALEDATKENGCLWSIPGSHKEGQPRRRFFKDPDGKLAFDKPCDAFDLADFRPLEVKAGTMVVIHALNQHYSAPNLSDKSRCAYILHAYDGPQDSWAADNWLHRSPDLPLVPIYDDSTAVSAH